MHPRLERQMVILQSGGAFYKAFFRRGTRSLQPKNDFPCSHPRKQAIGNKNRFGLNSSAPQNGKKMIAHFLTNPRRITDRIWFKFYSSRFSDACMRGFLYKVLLRHFFIFSAFGNARRSQPFLRSSGNRPGACGEDDESESRRRRQSPQRPAECSNPCVHLRK